jgi:NAD(P)-dependent dehydrogenase (short-subunit alcohol dehydrogenase family)
MKLEGKIAIVTGAGRGIGRATSLVFAREGADVVVVARTQSEIEAVAAEVRAMGRRALAVPTDLSQESQIEAMVQASLKEYGRIDVLVNNAATPAQHVVAEMPTDAWEYVLRVNLTAPFLACRAVVRSMMMQRSGCIVNVSSRAAKVGRVKRSAYCAAKGGLGAFTMALAKEVEEYNIRVNALLPGPVATKMLGSDPQILAEKILPPEAVADAILFLACDDSRGMTGTAIDVFGSPWP